MGRVAVEVNAHLAIRKSYRTYLGRVIRNIVRKIKSEADLGDAFACPLPLARQVSVKMRRSGVYDPVGTMASATSKSAPAKPDQGVHPYRDLHRRRRVAECQHAANADRGKDRDACSGETIRS